MSRPRVTLMAVSLLAAFAASACAAGGNAQTSRERPTINAVGGAIGTIAVRNVYVVGPAKEGGSAVVVAAFFNGGAESDTLSKVSSPVGSSGTLPGTVTLSPGGSNVFTPAVAAPEITDLQQPLLVGQHVPVTFTFARAGDLTLQVPVELPVGPTATPSGGSSATPSTEPTGTATPLTGASPTAQAAGPLG